MRILKHKQAVVKNNNGSIIIYYNYLGKELKYPTGIYLKFKDKKGIYQDWNYKLNKLQLPPKENWMDRQKIDELKTLKVQQRRIDDLLLKTNEIINEYFDRGVVINVDNLKYEIKHALSIPKTNSDLFSLLSDFIDRKRKQFEANGKLISLKDYKSLYLLLQDYSMFLNINIDIKKIDKIWLEDFIIYCQSQHPTHYGEYKVSSRGLMKNSTIKKRLDVLAEFFDYLKDKKIITADEADIVRKFKRGIKKNSVNKETLTISEVHKIYSHEYSQDSYKRIIDVFVFLCLTGIRYQDYFTFDSRFIKQVNGGFVYQKAASKTGIDYNIPLCKLVIKILENYNYELPKFTGQYANRQLKEALKETEYFNDVTQIQDKITKRYKLRYETITLHKGRDSFISNLVDTVPLNELMKYTGHKKLSTLQQYIDKKRPISTEYIKVFDI